MKKNDMKNDSTRPILRRSTRGTHKLKPTTTLHKSSCQSPVKSKTEESNIVNDKQYDGRYTDGSTSNPLTTPKSVKNVSYLKKTPNNNDDSFYSICSQQDPNRLVVWDGSSPDAVKFFQQRQRRRHISDVADIVQNLIIPDDEDGEVEDKESLLGLWLESKPFEPDQNKNKLGKKKEKTRKPKKGIAFTNDLLEKLEKAVSDVQGEADSSKETFKPEESAVQNTSKDLFDCSIAQSDVLVSPVFGKKTENKANVSDAWSEDDFLEDDSFVIKATQNFEECFSKKPMTSHNKIDTPSNKRKPSGNNNEEPLSKVGKYTAEFQNIHCQGKPPVVLQRTCLPNTSKLSVKPSIKKASPFRKFRSFDDEKVGKNSFRNDHAKQVKPISSTNLLLNTTMSREEQGMRRIVQDNKVSQNAIGVKQSSNYFHKGPTGNSASRNYIARSSSIGFNQASSKQNVISVPDTNSKPVSTSTYTKHIYTTTKSAFTTKPCRSFYKSVNPTQIQNSQTYVQYKSSTVQKQTTNQYHVTSLQNRQQLDNNCVCVPPKANTVGALQNNGRSQVPVPDTLVKLEKSVESKRRSAGAFDTSLSDDLLCQLAEPDELLESQLSQKLESPVKLDRCIKKMENSSSSRICAKKHVFNQSSDDKAIVHDMESVNLQNGIKKEKKASETCVALMGSSDARSGGKYSFKSKSSQVTATVSSSTKQEKSLVYTKDSEDLFSSDTDDDLSEPQILALLDDVELKATQMNRDLNKEYNESQFCIEVITSEDVDHGRPSSQTSNSASPFKCTPEEIEEKRKAALSKLKQKSSVSKIPDSEDVDTSPCKCSDDNIEKKVSIAITPKQRTNSTSSNSNSPFKCSPSEIEQKKNAALARRRQKSGAKIGSQSSPTSSGIMQAISPSKLLQEEIERKKQAALKRREERQKATRNLNFTLSLTGPAKK